jgi:hypothetical protein
MRLAWLVVAEVAAVAMLPRLLRMTNTRLRSQPWRTGPEQAQVDEIWGNGARIVDSRRQDIFYEALDLVGLSAAKEPVLFRAALGVPPVGVGFDIAHPYYQDASGQTHGVSTCALVAREILRRAGCAVPSLELPYVIGQGFADIIEAARVSHCLILGGDLVGADTGDAIIWAGPSPAPGMAAPGHIATIVAICPESVVTVDGGSTDGGTGLQKIAMTTRHRPFALGAPIGYVRSRNLPWKA